MEEKKTIAEEPEHECDPYGHCMHGDTAENRFLEGMFEGGVIRKVPGCPLCEAPEIARGLD